MGRAKRGSVVAVCGGAELAAIVERGLGFRIASVYCLGWAGPGRLVARQRTKVSSRGFFFFGTKKIESNLFRVRSELATCWFK